MNRNTAESGIERWRLLVQRAGSGAWNMAVDLALLSSAIQGGLPALRIYSWNPPALSLGYNQNAAVVDWAACAAAGIDVVRRPTGGRAVLHADELTYAVVLPPAHRLAQLGVQAAYKELSRGLLSALQKLGLDCELALPTREAGRHPNLGGEGAFAACFDAPSWYELVVGGKKVVGSAQVRRRGALLQHGAIPLHLDGGDLYQVLSFANEAAREKAAALFRRKAAGLSEVAGREISAPVVVDALIQGFAEGLGVEYIPDELSAEEIAAAQSLLEEVAVCPGA